jgi:hypothetical protein
MSISYRQSTASDISFPLSMMVSSTTSGDLIHRLINQELAFLRVATGMTSLAYFLQIK